MFDRYVEERRKPIWYRRSMIGASIVTHGIVGLFLFAITLFTVDEIRPPALAVVFLKAPPPPPPLPPAFGKHHDTPKPATTPIKPRVKPTRVIVQPVEKPLEPDLTPDAPKDKEKPKADEEDVEEGDPDGVVGGSKEGDKDGTLSGVEGGMKGPSGPTAPIPLPVAPPKPRVVASFIFDRERINFPDPHLPESFLQSHAGQTVKGMYRICVDQDGKVFKMETITSISGVDQSIIDQVIASWLYQPQPVPICTIRVFEFHIH
jgi:hypothetical protein